MLNPDVVLFSEVELIDHTGLTLTCRVAGTTVRVPPLRILEGTTIRRTGDRGTLVLPRDVAADLGLV